MRPLPINTSSTLEDSWSFPGIVQAPGPFRSPSHSQAGASTPVLPPEGVHRSFRAVDATRFFSSPPIINRHLSRLCGEGCFACIVENRRYVSSTGLLSAQPFLSSSGLLAQPFRFPAPSGCLRAPSRAIALSRSTRRLSSAASHDLYVRYQSSRILSSQIAAHDEPASCPRNAA